MKTREYWLRLLRTYGIGWLIVTALFILVTVTGGRDAGNAIASIIMYLCGSAIAVLFGNVISLYSPESFK
jgi:hypothetical protein